MKRTQEEEASIKARKLENKEVTVDEEDYLSRLPEEILIYILNKVSDLKSLCRCSVASKHIASLIPHVTTITLTLPSMESTLFQIYKEIYEKLDNEITQKFGRECIRVGKLPQFVEKFRGLESIFLEYICPDNDGANKLLRWNVKWSETWTTAVVLLPASVLKKADPEPAPVQEQGVVLSPRDDYLSFSFFFFLKWWLTLCLIAISHSSVRSVTIADSERRGIFTVGDKQLARLRRTLRKRLVLTGRQVKEGRRNWKWKIGMVPFLELPLSGYVMRDVYLVILHTGEDGDHQDYEDLLDWDFGEEEKLFGEAVKEILKKHRDTFWSKSP